MMSALRWWLLILGVLFIVGRELWEWRRPRQARSQRSGHASTVPEGAEAARLREEFEPARLREPVEPEPEWSPPEPPPAEAASGENREGTHPPASGEPPLELPEIHAREPIGVRRPPLIELTDEDPQTPVEAADELPERHPMTLEDGPPADAEEPEPSAEVAASPDPAPDAPAPPREALPELPPAPAPLVDWPPDDQRQVVALRLVATQAARFGGRSIRQALAAEGFVLGRFAIFHKPDEDCRAVLSAASLTRPGTFDPETMDSQHYGGLSLFAVLPGPKAPPDAFEELVMTARSLNERLCGVLQDEAGTPLTPARIATLRERISAGASS